MPRSRSTTEDASIGRVAPDEEHVVTSRRYSATERNAFRTPKRVRVGITAYPVPIPTPDPWQEWGVLLRDEDVREALHVFEVALRAARGATLRGSFERTTSVHAPQDVDVVGTSHGQVWFGQVKAMEMPDLPNLIDLTGVLADMPHPEGIELLYEGRPVAGPEFWSLALPREAQARIINGVTELVRWLTELERLRNALIHGLPSAPAAEPAPIVAPMAPAAVAAPAPATPAPTEEVSGEAGAQTEAPLEDVLRDEHPQLLAMYREANTVGLREVAVQLRVLFSTKELAYMADTSTRTIRNWVGGSVEQARPEAASRLRAVFTCVLILRQEEGPSVIKNWFTNTNPYLDFHAPAQVIRAGKLREAIKAARVYAEYAGA